MNTTIDALVHRLELLLDGLHFRCDFDKALDSPQHLMAIGEHNLREYHKLEAMGEEHNERIQNLFANILASRLQEEAMAKYGSTDRISIRQVLHGWFNRPESQAFDDRLRQTTKLAVLGFNLTEEQCDAVMKGMYDKLPKLIMVAIEELIGPFCFLPCSEAQSIATALTDMIKEVENADSQRHN